MKKIGDFIACFMLLLSTNCFGQDSWSQGYIIDKDGLVIHGYIEMNDSRSNSEFCSFKTGKETEVIKYMPEDISSYRFTDGKYFISRDMRDLGFNKTVFLEFLIEGKLNVYHFKDVTGHYFVEKEGEWYMLTNSTQKTEKGDKTFEVDKKEYIGLLNVLLEDADIKSDISHTILEGKSLIKLAKNYHEEVCPDEKCFVYERKMEAKYVRTTPYIGVTLSRVDIGNSLISDYHIDKTAGISFEFFNVFRFRERWSLKVDLAIQHFSNYTLYVNEGAREDFYYNSEYYTIWNENAYWEMNNMDVNLKTFALQVPVSLNYTFSKGKFRPYVGVGIAQMIFFAQRSDFKYISSTVLYEQAIPSYNFGYIGRIGGEYIFNDRHSLNFELRYEDTMSLNAAANLFFSKGIPSLICGYTF